MTNANIDNFNWTELLRRIKRKNVIPVIGHGLYRVNVKSEGKENILLYDYLAEKVLEECGGTINQGETCSFLEACLEFLKRRRDGYLELSEFLNYELGKARLIADNSLLKLARIKHFDLFINLGYDNLLSNTISLVRSIPTNVFSYTIKEKDFSLFNYDLFISLKNFRSTLVYHVLGNFENLKPAFTATEVSETLVKFYEDMLANPKNNLIQRLKNSYFLFIGYRSHDWLLRFFIRFLTGKSFNNFPKDQLFEKFMEDNFCRRDKSWEEISILVRDRDIEVFNSIDGSDLVDMLFEKVESDDPKNIISPCEFPSTAFISFEGTDRPVAESLVDNLKKDGVNVWLDKKEFKGGDDIDEKILKAIDRCPAFIPLVSENARKMLTDDGKLKYHIREWEHAYANKINKNTKIIPVAIDDTNWKYEKFKSIYHLKIKGGDRVDEYEKLRKKLFEIKKER